MSNSSSLRSFRSLDDLAEHRRVFDIKVGYGLKAVPPLVKTDLAPKALVITVFRNGDPYFPGIKVSLRPGNHFLNLAGFCDYLGQRLKIPQGVRHIFNLEGSNIYELSDLKDGECYVASGVKTFKDTGYGKLVRLHTTTRPNATSLRPEDMLLFRQPHHKTVEDEGLSLAGSRESCVITVVNRKKQAQRSRVLLNLKTRQSWEEVIMDMGQAIGLKRTTRMLTQWGEEVKSFSHMKNDFGDVETFYLDINDSKRHLPQRSNSDSNIKENFLDGTLKIKLPEDNNL